MSDNTLPEPIPCNECQAGVMRVRFITYFTWLDEELVMVPNFPAWICDVCGRREYDEKSISWLTMLLNPNAGKPTGKKPHPRGTPRPAPRPSASPKLRR
ncbi:MAG: YgiT-type zinc finger protein [Chloroflexi bacterium]|nr:YgiT-type zinc finger protein [Chloroflexota bacterium]